MMSAREIQNEAQRTRLTVAYEAGDAQFYSREDVDALLVKREAEIAGARELLNVATVHKGFGFMATQKWRHDRYEWMVRNPLPEQEGKQ